MVQFIKCLFCKHEDGNVFLDHQHPCKHRTQWHKSVTTSLGEGKNQEDPHSWPASRSTQLSGHSTQWETLSQTIRWGVTEKDTCCQIILTSSSTAWICAYTQTHTNACTHMQNQNKMKQRCLAETGLLHSPLSYQGQNPVSFKYFPLLPCSVSLLPIKLFLTHVCVL